MSPQVVFASLVLILLVKPAIGDGFLQCKEQERQALLEIKQELVDEYNQLSSWTSETDCCRNWRGVRCSNRTGHVIMLDLHAPELIISGKHLETPLSGNISPSLLKLRHLKHLDLSHNNLDNERPILDFNGALGDLEYVNFSRCRLNGSLSYQFANLSRLQSLDLSFNPDLRYTWESIHWLSSLSFLRVLDLSTIDLGGVKDLLQVVKTLPNLRKLRLENCNLSNIHFSFGTSLQELSLVFNSLDGFIPAFIGNMTSLINLDLSFNNFRGGVPKSFGRRLCRLQRFDLSGNNLEGDLEILVGNISGCMEKSLEILKLEGNELHGSLPDLSIFTNLREVDLSNNQLNGSLPKKFMHPSKLEQLTLGYNQLTGSIPDVAMLPFLKELYVRDNRLNGTVPQSIGGLSELEVLDAPGNSLTGTLSEPHFLNLSKIKWLDLSGNSLSLKLSQNWTPPFQLEVIGLATCKQESGFSPRWIQTQKNCSVLDISDSGISDTVPSWLWDFSSELTTLNLSFNRLHGKLPHSSTKFPRSLEKLDLSSNNLKGELPLLPPSMTSLHFSGNKFSGNISILCRITSGVSVHYLDLSANNLTGKIPDCFGESESLLILNLANNRFFGEIPSSIGHMSQIQVLNLHNNSFHGIVPSSLGNCKELEFMDLSDNNLSGTLPAWIGQNLSSLIFLSLKSNHFSGILPRDFCKLMNIQILDLAINNISGVIPQCICHFTAMIKPNNSSSTLVEGFDFSNKKRIEYIAYIHTAIVRWKGGDYLYGKNLGFLRIIDLSSNRLTGEIPSEITRLVALTALNLSRNELFGKISRKIGDLKKIESLDLSNNQLSGEIPSSLSDLSFLSYLDLSNNNLSGRIPSGTQIGGFNITAFSGNLGLCGKPLETECPGESTFEGQENPKKEDPDENDNYEFWTRFHAGIGLGFVIGFWGMCIVPLLKRGWRVSYLGFLNYLILRFHILLARFKNSRAWT